MHRLIVPVLKIFFVILLCFPMVSNAMSDTEDHQRPYVKTPFVLTLLKRCTSWLPQHPTSPYAINRTDEEAPHSAPPPSTPPPTSSPIRWCDFFPKGPRSFTDPLIASLVERVGIRPPIGNILLVQQKESMGPMAALLRMKKQSGLRALWTGALESSIGSIPRSIGVAFFDMILNTYHPDTDQPYSLPLCLGAGAVIGVIDYPFLVGSEFRRTCLTLKVPYGHFKKALLPLAFRTTICHAWLLGFDRWLREYFAFPNTPAYNTVAAFGAVGVTQIFFAPIDATKTEMVLDPKKSWGDAIKSAWHKGSFKHTILTSSLLQLVCFLTYRQTLGLLERWRSRDA